MAFFFFFFFFEKCKINYNLYVNSVKSTPFFFIIVNCIAVIKRFLLRHKVH